MAKALELLKNNGMRKVFCFVLCTFTLTGLCAFNKVTGQQFVDSLPWIFALTVAGNTLEHYSKSKVKDA